MVWLLVLIPLIVSSVPVYKHGSERRRRVTAELRGLTERGLVELEPTSVEGRVDGIDVRVELYGAVRPRGWSRVQAVGSGLAPLRPLGTVVGWVGAALMMLTSRQALPMVAAGYARAMLGLWGLVLVSVATAGVAAGAEDWWAGLRSHSAALRVYAEVPGAPQVHLSPRTDGEGYLTGDVRFDATVCTTGSLTDAMAALPHRVRRRLVLLDQPWKVENGTIAVVCPPERDVWKTVKRAALLAREMEVADSASALMARIVVEPDMYVRHRLLWAAEAADVPAASRFRGDMLRALGVAPDDPWGLVGLLEHEDAVVVHIALVELARVGTGPQIPAILAVDDLHAEVRGWAVATIRDRASAGAGGLTVAGSAGGLSITDGACG